MRQARSLQRSVAAVLLAALLAGCSGGGAGTEAVEADGAIGGVLTGVVVDEAIRPLAGARVSIPVAPEAGTLVTGDDGMFRFEDLALGVVVLLVERDGFLSTTNQVEVKAGEPDAILRISLLADPEDRPYVVQEAFDGFIACGVGSAVVFGLTAPCQQLAGAGLDVACRGQDPVPAAGACVGGTSPYHVSTTGGNITMVQSELYWEASLSGSELMLTQWAMAPDGQLIKGMGGDAGPSFLVSRLNATVLDEHAIGAPNLLALYISIGNEAEATVVAQQGYKAFHTTAYRFEFDAAWSFIENGPAVVPDDCTVCLRPE